MVRREKGEKGEKGVDDENDDDDGDEEKDHSIYSLISYYLCRSAAHFLTALINNLESIFQPFSLSAFPLFSCGTSRSKLIQYNMCDLGSYRVRITHDCALYHHIHIQININI